VLQIDSRSTPAFSNRKKVVRVLRRVLEFEDIGIICHCKVNKARLTNSVSWAL
jgi:hypothetical protein